MCLFNFQQLTIKLLALLTLIKLMQLSPDFLHPGATLRRLFLQLGAPGLGFPHALQLLRGVVRVPNSSAAIAVQDKLGAADYLSAAQTIAFGAAFLSLRRLPPLQLGIITHRCSPPLAQKSNSASMQQRPSRWPFRYQPPLTRPRLRVNSCPMGTSQW